MSDLLAKRTLYAILLGKDSLTDNEIDLMYLLSKDEQIQAFLERKGKNTVSSFFERNKADMSIRLQNIILSEMDKIGSIAPSSIEKEWFLSVRRAGIGSWEELQKLIQNETI